MRRLCECFKYRHLVNDMYAAPALEDQFFEDSFLEYSGEFDGHQDEMEIVL